MRPETLLYRMVHPSWTQEETFSSQVFRPTPKDDGRLSVYDGSQITPEAALRHFTNLALGGHEASGVVAVTVAECEDVGIAVILDGKPFPEHAYLDFTGLTRNAIRRKADQLKQIAADRGWVLRS